jgi:hypothetical protein
MFSGVFIAEDADGVGNKGLGDITTAEIHSHLEAI